MLVRSTVTATTVLGIRTGTTSVAHFVTIYLTIGIFPNIEYRNAVLLPVAARPSLEAPGAAPLGENKPQMAPESSTIETRRG